MEEGDTVRPLIAAEQHHACPFTYCGDCCPPPREGGKNCSSVLTDMAIAAVCARQLLQLFDSELEMG